jgi:hypothetical protein
MVQRPHPAWNRSALETGAKCADIGSRPGRREIERTKISPKTAVEHDSNMQQL